LQIDLFRQWIEERNPMSASGIAIPAKRREEPARPNMIWIPGGTFRMGSERHYPEEAPAHRVTVDPF
jgi:formylglycine-generating enzyme